MTYLQTYKIEYKEKTIHHDQIHKSEFNSRIYLKSTKKV